MKSPVRVRWPNFALYADFSNLACIHPVRADELNPNPSSMAMRPQRGLCALVLFMAAPCGAQSSNARLAVPVEFHTLSNGLRVVLSRDPSVPLARVGVYYAAGPRREPRGRGGLAPL